MFGARLDAIGAPGAVPGAMPRDPMPDLPGPELFGVVCPAPVGPGPRLAPMLAGEPCILTFAIVMLPG